MTLGQRIGARATALGVSQSELARRVGVNSTTINGLIRGPARWTPYLFKIARALETTAEFLVGETDDPDANAPPAPPPRPASVMLEVVLPPEAALARMFEGLLATIDPEASPVERALLLARRLPIGLSQLRDLRPVPAMPQSPSVALAEADAGPATAHHGSPQ